MTKGNNNIIANRYSGSCLCGEVKYSLAQRPEIMNLCHCSMCRKVTGSTYGTFAHTGIENFRWDSAQRSVARYESSPGEFRVFCRVCGSCLPVVDAENGSVCIPAGTFDDDPGVKPAVEIFLGSKAPWYCATGDIPGFEEFAPDDFQD